MRNKICLTAAAAMLALVLWVPAQPAEARFSTFPDLSYFDYGTKAQINYLTNHGIIMGYPDNTFRPHTPVTRGQFASFIARAYDLPMPKSPKQFKDVTGKVSTYEGIIKASDAGLIHGYPDNRFRPNEEISRAQIAIILDKALQARGSYPEKAALTYTDRKSIGKSSYEAVQRLTHYGIMESWSKLVPPPGTAVGTAASQRGSHFYPEFKGDRLETAQSIYSLLEVTNLLDDTAIKTPNGWTTDRLKEHQQTAIDTVFKYSPKVGTGASFGIGSFGLHETERPDFRAKREAYLKSLGTNLNVDDWLDGLNYAIQTGDIYIAPDYSFAIYFGYGKGTGAIFTAS